MEGWVEVVGLDFIVNCVLTPKGKIYRVVAGHYISAHRQGVQFAREIYGVPARERAEIALVSSHPADFDLWQGTKGILSGELILKDGGTLILLAPCFEGVGPHPSFPDYIGGEGLEPLLQEARAGRLEPREVLPLSVGFLLNKVRKRIKIFLVSTGITAQEATRAGFVYFPNPEAALGEALRRHGLGARIAVIPYGGHTYPYLTGREEGGNPDE
jgi:nickel-dependent lactate racemase